MKPPSEQTSGGDVMVADQLLAGLDLAGCTTEIEMHEAVYGYKHTARRIKEHQPEKFQRILLGLTEGMPIEQIALLCGCSHNTIDSIIDSDFPGGRQGYDAKMVEVMQRIVRQCGDKLRQLVPKCEDPQKVAVIMGITEEKLAMRRGAPGLNVNVTVTHLDHADEWYAKFDEMKRRAQERQAVGREVTEGQGDGENEGLALPSVPPSLCPPVSPAGKAAPAP